MNLSRLAALVRKELREFLRDRVLLLFVIYAFTLDVLGDAGLRLTLNEAGLRALDHDQTTVSRELIGRFTPPHFALRPPPPNANAMVDNIDLGRDMVGLVIPNDFAAGLARGERRPIQVLLDGSMAAQASLAEAYTREIVGTFARDVALAGAGLPPDATQSLPVIEPALRVRFNPNRNEAYHMGLNAVLMMLSLLAIILPASALVREREHGTIEQLLVSPLAPWEILLAKTIASTLILLSAAAIAIFGILLPLIHLPVRGSLLTFFACAAVFVFSMSGLGMTVASLCRTMPQVGMVSLLLIAPVLFLSGAWTPPEAMPIWLARLTTLSPLRWFNDIAIGVFLRGATLADLARPIAAMSGLGALFFTWGATRFRRRFR